MLTAQSFFIATARAFSLLWCLAIRLAKGAQSFFDATVLSHFYCCSTQLFSIATVLGHFRCYSPQPFLVITAREATRSFCKMTELGRGRTWATRGSVTGARDRATLGVGLRGTELRDAQDHVGRGSDACWIGRLVRWLGPGDGPWVHHTR
jgi:hypothetical protein